MSLTRCMSVMPLLAFILISFPLNGAAALDISINTSKRHQTIEGFGTCLFLRTTHPYDRRWFQEMYARDLGASILRMEFTPWVLKNPVKLGPNLQDNIKLFDFSAAGGTPTIHQMIQAVNANKLDQLKLIGSLWTPPHWMKTDAKINGDNSCGGHLIDTPENLQQFARYIAAYVKGWEQTYGVPVYALSIQNELLFDEPYNSCIYTPQEYHDAVKAVADEFKRDGIQTKLEGPESVGPDGAWFTQQQMSFIHAVEDDPATANDLNFFSIHDYGGNGIDVISDGKALRDYWDKIQSYGKQSWMTEFSGERPEWLHDDGKGGQDGALSLAKHLHEGLVYGNYNAVVYWQIGSGGGEGGNQYELTGPTPASDAAPTQQTPKYCAAKQFFRFIRPGAVRVEATPETPNLGVSAFVHDKNKTLTVVMVNMAATDEPIHLTLPAHSRLRSFAVYRTSASEGCAQLPAVKVDHGRLALTIPAQSVVTLYGHQG